MEVLRRPIGTRKTRVSDEGFVFFQEKADSNGSFRFQVSISYSFFGSQDVSLQSLKFFSRSIETRFDGLDQRCLQFIGDMLQHGTGRIGQDTELSGRRTSPSTGAQEKRKKSKLLGVFDWGDPGVFWNMGGFCHVLKDMFLSFIGLLDIFFLGMDIVI